MDGREIETTRPLGVEEVEDAGFQADVRPVSEVDRIEAYDAVLVGGALYSGQRIGARDGAGVA